MIMSRIKVQNFGPIKAGFMENDGFMDIRKVTIFIGDQGTGKSSVAKLISIVSQLEKTLYNGKLTEKDVSENNYFALKYLNNYNLFGYLLPESVIEYRGNAYNITINNKKVKISNASDKAKKYLVPKIVYIPAERNFFSVVKSPKRMHGLPGLLYYFLEDLYNSLRQLSDALPLPIGDAKLEFIEISDALMIVGNNYRLRLSNASSGFQSLVPLFVVSRQIALSIEKSQETFRDELSGEDQKRLKNEIDKILSNDNLSDEFKKIALETLSSKYRNECFLNIVEEIEQNLFPQSQKNIFYKLLEFANLTRGNKLILTTHSPYIINDLTLAIKADEVLKKILSSSRSNTDELRNKLNEIVPEKSCISKEDAIVYELTEQGEIKKLPTYEGLPSDENYLNAYLAETNQLFDELLEIEEQI